MKPELHPEEKDIRDIGCLGQHDSGPWVYATEVTVTITVDTGDVVANSKEEARAAALERARDMVHVHGNGYADEWEPLATRQGEE